MRTTINYQYRNGTTFPTALRTLYADGGIPRFYRGVLPALIQGPLSRFGDTAANTGMLTLMDSYEFTRNLNVGFKTVSASVAAALFRIFLMPVDTIKTTMQVTGKFSAVVDKIKTNGPLRWDDILQYWLLLSWCIIGERRHSQPTLVNSHTRSLFTHSFPY